MTEFQELVKDAPEFALMERGELVAYAYGMYAAGAKTDAENAKLRELAEKAWKAAEMLCQAWDGPCHADGVSIMSPCPMGERDELCVYGLIQRDLRELGVEVDG